MSDQTPTLATVLSNVVRSASEGVACAMPGVVKSYDSATQKADVQPAVKRAEFDESGELIHVDYPVIQDVPIMFPGAGAYRMTFPVVAGDMVLLVFSDVAIDKWKQNGSAIPTDPRRHNISDAVAIPGLFNFNSTPTDAPTNALTIHGDTVVVDADTVKLGSAAATELVALKSDLAALKTALTAPAFATALALVTATPGDLGVGTTAYFTSALSVWPVGSTKTKVE